MRNCHVRKAESKSGTRRAKVVTVRDMPTLTPGFLSRKSSVPYCYVPHEFNEAEVKSKNTSHASSRFLFHENASCCLRGFMLLKKGSKTISTRACPSKPVAPNPRVFPWVNNTTGTNIPVMKGLSHVAHIRIAGVKMCRRKIKSWLKMFYHGVSWNSISLGALFCP